MLTETGCSAGWEQAPASTDAAANNRVFRCFIANAPRGSRWQPNALSLHTFLARFGRARQPTRPKDFNKASGSPPRSLTASFQRANASR